MRTRRHAGEYGPIRGFRASFRSPSAEHVAALLCAGGQVSRLCMLFRAALAQVNHAAHVAGLHTYVGSIIEAADISDLTS